MPSRKRPDEGKLPEELAELERALASFQPALSRVDRDRLMFEAGAASGMARSSTDHGGELRRRPPAASHRPWQMATAAAALVACVFASLYVGQPNRPATMVGDVPLVERERPAEEVVAAFPRSASAKTATATDTPISTDRSPRSLHRLPFVANVALLGANPTSNYIALRDLVLTRGIDALPQREYIGDEEPLPEPLRPPITAHELMKEFLVSPAAEVSTDAGGASWQKPTHSETRGTT